MSTLEVNTINPQSGTTITIGGSGDTVTLGSGATQSGFGGENTPAFEAVYSGGGQGYTTQVWTKVIINSEYFDTDNCFDTSTYRFTPTTAGKYFIYGQVFGSASTSNMYNHGVAIYKNGTGVKQSYIDFYSSAGNAGSEFLSAIVDMNGSTDYVELYVRTHDTSGNPTYYRGSSYDITYFGGFKLI